MCGIAGIFNFNDSHVLEKELKKMCEVLHHRGPDDEGFHISKNVGLGHKRLSIIDIASGNQPMSNEDEKIWITCNGEIYNYKELRKELIKLGHKFKTNSDTEVIVHAYEEWQENCVNHLNGMFAFAIYDGEKLFLARDRFGIKPLYYTISNGRFIFASEIKAILQAEGVKVNLNQEAVFEYFTFQNTFGDKTWFKNIKLLLPGHYLTCAKDGVQVKNYWKLNYPEIQAKDKSETDYAHELKKHFEEAVKRQLVSEVPLGTYLSGGMDTGSISALASKYIKPLHTFTCGFDLNNVDDDERIFDERKNSLFLSQHLNTTHHEVVLNPNHLEKIFPKLLWHLEEPRVGISYQIYYVNELIKKYVTVVLSGCGGDELFGGYHWRYEPILNCKNKNDFTERYYKSCIRLLADEEKNNLFLPEIKNELNGFSTFDSFNDVLKNYDFNDPLSYAMCFDTNTFLHGLLIVDDKLSMAHSVETRVPFLDSEFINYAITIPPELKLKDGNSKHILKLAMQEILPEEVLNRPKVGFVPPDKSWYRGETKKYIEGLLLSKHSISCAYFSFNYLQNILDDHFNKRYNNRALIWSLMCFEWWNRVFTMRGSA